MRILLVEDNEDDVILLEGYWMAPAHCRSKWCLLDLWLPDSKGLTTLKKM